MTKRICSFILLSTFLFLCTGVSAQDVILKYRCGDTDPSNNIIKPQLQVVNNSGEDIDMSQLTIRYYYTKEGAASEAYDIYWFEGNGTINRTLVDGYVELSFPSGTILSGSGYLSSRKIDGCLHKADWSACDESNDYSFDSSKIDYDVHDKITIHKNGVLIFGSEPGEAVTSSSSSTPVQTSVPTAVPTAAPTSVPSAVPTNVPTGVSTNVPTTAPTDEPTPAPIDEPQPGGIALHYKCSITTDRAQSMRPWLKIYNNSGTSIDMKDLKLRYYYSKEGIAEEKLISFYVAIGSSNISATFLPENGYVEVSFASGAGSIEDGSNSGEIQIGFQKVTDGYYIQSNDYSFDPSITNYAEYDRIPLYHNGSLICGKEGPAPTPTPDPPPSGDDWLHVNGNCIEDANGKVVRLTGINWFGYETGGAKGFFGLDKCSLEESMDLMAARGFNLLRIPICVEMIKEWQNGTYVNTANVNYAENPTLDGMNSLQILDYAVDYLKRTGMKIMFDMHSADRDGYQDNLWYNSGFSTSDLISAWKWLATRYNGDDTVVAMDLKNEPHGKYSGSSIAKWDDSNDPNNWKKAAEDIGNAVLSINKNLLIMVEGVESFPMEGYDYTNCGEFTTYTNWWGGNLRGVDEYPVTLSVSNRLVYSPHDYGPLVYAQEWFYSGFNQNTLYYDCWQPNWYYIVEQGIAPLLIGEWGGKLDGGDNEKWLKALANFMVQENLHHTFWCFNPNSGDTGGLVKDDWKTVDEAKYAIIEPTLWQDKSGKYVGLDQSVILGTGSTGTNIPAYYSGGASAPSPPVALLPSEDPTAAPTAVPTSAPTDTPTSVPTAAPTLVPTEVPTGDPTTAPTGVPTTVPTAIPTSVPTSPPTDVPTEVPVADPTSEPTESSTTGSCSCKAGCDSISAIEPDFAKNGNGEYCFEATSLGRYINSWNMDILEVNGVNFTNKYTTASRLPEKIDGKYYVYYKSNVPWGHFEAKN
jgi:endoglucanase